ncbi:NitT/TauT family transport system permease protein [Amycolatopsis bartoniae]|uniref:ABC transporter permease n=1 Tax=Amycolatopsis bartoniae TaxID=941986 RepID=A0A8H9IMS7_9PSEU|nr:ABC transporter permease [Amycolatopsis bartoniae]MBB2940221.1 NitT/TauT family transport system permease protein [Amycolatopsis bartoniae]TVT10180.1 ABC transporter permease [Amycolatopsis bartoniae]GHF35104.1 ABC transporter permease [Amycolatopsis bartoniae]
MAAYRSEGGPAIRLLQLAALVAVVIVWALITEAGLFSAAVLPGPGAVAGALVQALGDGSFWGALGETLRGAVTGLVAAIVIGVPLGLITGSYPVAEESTRLLVDVLRAFPVIALLPVFLLVLGSTPEMKATVVFLACVFPMLLQAQYGARSVSAAVRETVHGYRIPRLLRFRRVVLPAASPSIMTGLRVAATMSVLVAIGVEVLTTLPGMGHEIVQRQQAGASAEAYAFILAAGLLGFGINLLAQTSERHLLRWRAPAHTN